VEVVNPDGQSFTLSGAFTYQAAPPTVTSISPTNGLVTGGAVVTISGSNFVSGLTVEFGGILSPTITFINTNTVTAVTPADVAGAVAVEVINPDGQSFTLSGAFLYQAVPPPPPPIVSSITLSGANLVIVSSGATNGTCLVLTTTDLAAAITNWTVLATNTVDGSGLFTNTIPLDRNESQGYFILAIPSPN
jgi:hypothetical protein